MNNKELKIANILKDLGVSVGLCGYQYLKYAIGKALEDTSFLRFTTKVVYPEVAKHFKTTPSKVERGMRHAIESGWCICNADTRDALFGYSVSASKGKPTNGQYIATIVDFLQMTQEG
jgi:two-component system response regulator (stage 0 sporulation protein A)